MLLYNTLTRKKAALQTIETNLLRLYVCGITVYDRCHIGHGRVYVVFDTLVRYLRSRGMKVEYVRNITDIDDKIINIAAERGVSIHELTEANIELMHDDLAKLGCLAPSVEPRATHCIPEMIDIIETLIDKGLAYAAVNGDVYYSVSKFPDYGKLSGRKLEDMRAGERVAPNPNKKDPMDFVLWKASKDDEPDWPSPWGDGRPGWHIECSAMANKYLGHQIDLHGGGEDLPFPHHENEIAQSEGAFDCCFSKQWMHVGFVNLNAEKMSKSTGNFFTVDDVLQVYPAEVVRYFLLSAHYRSQINYSAEQLDAAQAALSALYTALRDTSHGLEPQDHNAADEFHNAMRDDLNTPAALGVLHKMAASLNKAKTAGDEAGILQFAYLLHHLGGTLGLLQQDPEDYFQRGVDDAEAIEALIEARRVARAEKDFALADRIRDQLLEMGVELEDKDGQTVWRKA